MRYNRKQVEQMVAETEESISLLLKNEAAARQAQPQPQGQALQKSDDMPPTEDKKPEDSAPPAASASDASASAPPPMAEGSDSSAAGAPPMDASASAGGLPTVEELKAEYAQLSPEEFQLHAQAMAAVIAEKQGGAPAGAGAPPQPAPPPPAAGADATLPGEGSQGIDPAMAMKSEQIEAEVKDLKKSLEEQKAINADLKKSVDSVAQILSKVFAPKQKAVTAMDAVPASTEPVKRLSKAEVNAKIIALDKSTLKKSDVDAIKDFYNGKVQVEAISHLLK